MHPLEGVFLFHRSVINHALSCATARSQRCASFQLPIVKVRTGNTEASVVMARILVMVLVAKLRIGTGQGVVELLQFVGFLLVCHVQRPLAQ
jgi:hypothetical protein